MREYTFKVGSFYFKIHANESKEAVTKARRALEESFSSDAKKQLKVDLDGGAFLGRLHIEPGEVTINSVCKVAFLPDDQPF